ncbi:MAG: bifunctional pyr operon transcriptional regulator/uracil phosphoribosyltransferase PyrR [Bacillota bacterium]|nr:bifunctional pyr operon transcriptional regulator/uracil phosphoribosyltransferase PyrR [Bacillota bacterium]
MKKILNQDEMRRAISRISHEILERNEDYKQIVFLGLVTRGFEIAERLQKRIFEIEKIQIPVYKLDISNYRDDLKHLDQRVEEIDLPDVDVDEKNVIIVDDVIFTGRTTRAALDAIVELGRPSRVQLVALVDRGHREFPIRPDYIGKNIPTSRDEQVILRLAEVDGVDEVLID